MTLLKPLKVTSLLTPYEHLFMQTLLKAGKLILEQNPDEINPLFQLAFDPSHPPTSPGWSNNNLPTVHMVHVSASHSNDHHNQICSLSNTENPLQNSHNLNLPLLNTCRLHPEQHPVIPQTS
jgi:hypothetical protein